MTVFCVYGQDNDSYAFRSYPVLTEFQQVHQELLPGMSGESRSGIRRCDTCGELLNKWDELLDGLVLKKRNFDITSTYDGVVVVSKRFTTAYESSCLSGLSFGQLADDPEFFAVSASRSIEFDAERRKTRFLKPCKTCNHFESVVGATPVCLKTGAMIGVQEFVRTDLEFGSNDEKHPLLLCGAIAADALRKAKLRGLDLLAIENHEPR
jgi:hypothetical protein